MSAAVLDGFEVDAVDLPVPPVPVGAEVRDTLLRMLAAALGGKTPEEIAGYLADGFPESVGLALDRPGERDELDALVDLLLFVQQSPALMAAG